MGGYGLMTLVDNEPYFHTGNSNTVCLGFIDIRGSGSFKAADVGSVIPDDKSFWYFPTCLQVTETLPDTEILAIIQDNKVIGFQWGHFSRVALGAVGNENNRGIRVYYGYY